MLLDAVLKLMQEKKNEWESNSGLRYLRHHSQDIFLWKEEKFLYWVPFLEPTSRYEITLRCRGFNIEVPKERQAEFLGEFCILRNYLLKNHYNIAEKKIEEYLK